jgi:stearoyl-CoA desaturase (Delta-9 desaturase)
MQEEEHPMQEQRSSFRSGAVKREGGGRRGMILVYLGLHLLPFIALWSGATWLDLWVGLLLMMGRGLCVSAGYHRLLAHHSYRTSRALQFVLAAGGCSALRGGPLWWVALHRHHHRCADTAADIHPAPGRFWWAYAGWLLSGRFVHTDYRLVKDLARRPELRWLNRHWLVPSAILALGCFLIGGWGTLAIGFGLSSVVLLHVLCLVDALDHRLGRRRYATPDDSRNSLMLALLALGEGWHNNHHHCPGSARQGFYWWETDTTWSALWLASRLGLVWGLHTPSEETLKRNLVANLAAKESESSVQPAESMSRRHLEERMPAGQDSAQ